MNQVYRKDKYVIVPVENNFIVINIDKQFKSGHTHVKDFNKARLMIDLAIKKKMPKNYHLVDSLIRITDDKDYIEKLKQFKEDETIDYASLMSEGHVYRRSNGAMRQVK